MADLVCIRVFESRLEAEMAAGLLSGSDVYARVQSDDAGGTTPALLPVTGGAKLLVRREDVERASEILRAMSSDESEDE
jgi:hypothetical protein